jgi:transposase
MARLYGRALRGQRVVCDIPGGHWKTWTMLSAVNLNGTVPTMVFEGGTDVAAMETFVAWLLIPELRSGDIVVMDNLAAHKSLKVKTLIESVGAEAWFLPTYSPDWNPIEHIWSKVKSTLKRIAPRSDKQLLSAIGSSIDAITKHDILNSIIHCGYVHTHS